MLKLKLLVVVAILISKNVCDKCYGSLEQEPCYAYSEAMGCVYAEPSNTFDSNDQALMHCK